MNERASGWVIYSEGMKEVGRDGGKPEIVKL